ncbi:hypothetical protein N8D56_11560 [Devosia sp. A8/3-2]|nr:hypothetical protein N8D56_11560 [Devosia sp. A8/3-2]
MKAVVRAIAAFGLTVAATLPALASPEGLWEIESKDSRYKVTLCGDGTQLCAELIWLGNGADSPENLPYLNTLLIDHAPQTQPNEWKGELHLYGQTAGGTDHPRKREFNLAAGVLHVRHLPDLSHVSL